MKKMIAYCGLVCTDCEAYVATQSNDMATLAKLAERAQKEFGLTVTPEENMCDGCLAPTGRQIAYCNTCEIHACGVSRKVENCAHCDDYACEKLAAFFKMATREAKPVLDAIRVKL